MYCTPHEMRMSSATRTKNARNLRRRKLTATTANAARSLALLMDELQEGAICARIKKAREEAELSQDQLAELLGVIKRTIQNYESERVPWRSLGKIGEITGKSTKWLLHGEEDGIAADKAEIVGNVLADLQRQVGEMRGQLADLLTRLPAPVDKAEELRRKLAEAARPDSEHDEDSPGSTGAGDP